MWLKPVVVHQHVDKVFEEVRLAGTEQASIYLVHGLFQLRDTVVVRHSIIATGKRRSPILLNVFLGNVRIRPIL